MLTIYSANIYNRIISGVEKNIDPTLKEAVSDFQNGCQEAFNYLMYKYDQSFKNNVFKYHDEDIYQELSMCLFNSAQKYKVGQNKAKFNSYFWTSAKNWLGSYGLKNTAQHRTAPGGTISMYSVNDEGQMLYESFVDEDEVISSKDKEFRNYIKDECTNFSELDKNIIRYLMDGYNKTEIARILGVSNPTVHKHIEKLRTGKFRKIMHDYSA